LPTAIVLSLIEICSNNHNIWLPKLPAKILAQASVHMNYRKSPVLFVVSMRPVDESFGLCSL
jgi:hypothetical protein